MPFPVDEKYIAATEEKLGREFPTTFRAKMMADNGGQVNSPPDAWRLYPFFDTSNKKRMKRTCNDIVCETASAKQWTGFPADAVAIGANGGGEQLILLPAEDGTSLGDEVYWWDHETGSIQRIVDDFGDLESR